MAVAMGWLSSVKNCRSHGPSGDVLARRGDRDGTNAKVSKTDARI